MRPRAIVLATTLTAAFALAAAPACSSHGDAHGDAHGGEDVLPPTGAPTDATDLVVMQDKDPDPGVVEVDLEARAAMKTFGAAPPTPVWTYDGVTSAPLIEAKVGDRLVVNFRNSLPEPTTIHWHGVRVPAAMDGTLAMQAPIPPGGTFRYAFTFKDAGLFWFHPHVRSDVQVHKGLYGAIRVRGAVEPEADVERVLVLDDVKLDGEGRISESLDERSLMMGREGNTLLVNGVSNARVRVDPGGLVRLRIVSAANGRYFNLRIPGRRLRVIGTDGGLLPLAYDVDTLLVSPGERYDVMFVADAEPGSEIPLVNEPYERGHGSGGRPASEVGRFSVGAGPRIAAKPMPPPGPALERLPDGAVDFPIRLNERRVGDQMVFTINDAVHPNIPALAVRSGDVRIMEISNESDMDHPFHLHGFFFQVLARSGAALPADALANKDTINVPARQSLRLVSRFDEPGSWMYHCHVLEHGEHGMMGELRVE